MCWHDGNFQTLLTLKKQKPNTKCLVATELRERGEEVSSSSEKMVPEPAVGAQE